MLRSKPKIAKRKTTEHEFTDGECTYQARLKAKEPRKTKLIASFECSGSLDPAKAKRKVRAR